jgi:hypothetical protein
MEVLDPGRGEGAGRQSAKMVPVAVGCRSVEPFRVFRRKIAICARVTTLPGQ